MGVIHSSHQWPPRLESTWGRRGGQTQSDFTSNLPIAQGVHNRRVQVPQNDEIGSCENAISSIGDHYTSRDTGANSQFPRTMKEILSYIPDHSLAHGLYSH